MISTRDGIRKRDKHGAIALPSYNKPLSEIAVCGDEQCGLSGLLTKPIQPHLLQTKPSDAFLKDQNQAKDKTNEEIFDDNDYAIFGIPSDLWCMIKDAAKKGLLTYFLLTLTEETLTDYLESLNYSKTQIYYVNQAIRALEIIALGSSWQTTMAVPLANYLLTNYVGLSNDNANYLTTGAALTVGMLSSPIGAVETSLVMGASIGAGILGAQIGKQVFNLAKNGFFSVKKLLENQITAQEDLAMEGGAKVKLD